ncbi:hypothetical protein FRC03_006008 [Tulasnella sp. 419]|nr:hypothetical protein FRC03_006008 [Tulasnella sp. 419]
MKVIVVEPRNVSHQDVTARLRITERNVARGSYSDVYRGYRVSNDGKTIAVAIKTFGHRGSIDSSDPVMNLEKLRRKLRQEVNIWGCLDHPNVVPLLGLSIPINDPPSLISPWYPNGNLTTCLKSSPDSHCTRILYDLSCGLEYLHSLDIVHGDIKPENVLLDADSRACWCDFGLAHFMEGVNGLTGETSSSTFRSGTVSFLSPEQVGSDSEGERKTTMMDIWAFGCLMAQVSVYFCLSPEHTME